MQYASRRVAQIPPYVFAEMNRKRDQLIRDGIDVIDLGIGDPDLPTPRPIVDKLVEELQDPANLKYPSFIGCSEFRTAVADFYLRTYNVELDPDAEVLALIGSKEGIAHLIPALVDPGDVVLMPDPGYPVYRTATVIGGGEPYGMPLTADNRFEPRFEDIPADIARRAKLMFLNYPGNPTSATVEPGSFERAVSYARSHGIAIAHDSAYGMVTFGDYKAPSILQAQGARELAIEFGSLSKTYNMTGWRIGYAVGNRQLIKSLSVVKSNTDTGAFTAIQKAAAFALRSDTGDIAVRNRIYRERIDVVLEGLAAIGVKVDPPRGSFFVWAPVPAGYTSASFVAHVMEQTGVMLTPGTAFGPAGEGYFRISVSVPSERLAEAMNRIRQKLKIDGGQP